MDNYSHSSYADSRDSSPRSCENNNPSWDDPPPSNSSYRVKFMCSYGGKIQPRNHDNKLTYTAGDTKILAVDRTITFSALSSKLSSLCNLTTVSFKYQLPGEDLDSLISVTNDEDLHHMMLEYDRLNRVSKPARLRLFLFPLNPPVSSIFASRNPKSDREWFVDALNSVPPNQPLQQSPAPPPPPSNPDFLFGFDKCYLPVVPDSDSTMQDVSAGSDCGSEDRHVVVSPSDLHMTERIGEKIAPPQAVVPLPVAPAYFPERQLIAGGIPPATGQSIYLFPTAGGLFQAQTVGPVTGPVGHQAYYGMQGSVQHPNAGYAQVAYDSTGRAVYFTAAPPYRTLAPGPSDGGAGSYNPEGNVIKVCDNK